MTYTTPFDVLLHFIKSFFYFKLKILNSRHYLTIQSTESEMNTAYNWTLIERNADIFANRWAAETDEKGEAKTF